MNKGYKIKITVMKKAFHSELIEQLSDAPQTWRDNSCTFIHERNK